MIHVFKRLDERDSTESFLDIDDVGSGWRICARRPDADKIRYNN